MAQPVAHKGRHLTENTVSGSSPSKSNVKEASEGLTANQDRGYGGRLDARKNTTITGGGSFDGIPPQSSRPVQK